MERKYTLKELRARHNLSQGDLGEKIGVAQITMHLYERSPERIKRMPYELLVRMADVLGVEPEQIYMGEDKSEIEQISYCPKCGREL